jgi:16S rRNA (uracil1498-N3)-methyltransferase
MPADRFYYPGPLVEGTSIQLEGDEHHHLSRVMRISIGEEIELVNGQGSLAHATVSDLAKRSATLHLLRVATLPRPTSELLLAIPLMRPSKLELIVEKGTELGADAFYFYPADHSEKDSLSQNQLDRLHHLILSALKQSGRLYLPQIELLPHLEQALRTSALLLYGDTRPDAPLLSTLKPAPRSLFITGPERGFSNAEIALLEKEAQGVKLNSNILRAETAPIAAAAILGLKKAVE